MKNNNTFYSTVKNTHKKQEYLNIIKFFLSTGGKNNEGITFTGCKRTGQKGRAC